MRLARIVNLGTISPIFLMRSMRHVDLLICGLAVVIKNFNTNTAGIGRVIHGMTLYGSMTCVNLRNWQTSPISWTMGLSQHRSLLILTFLDGLQAVDVVGPHRWEFSSIYLPGHHARAR